MAYSKKYLKTKTCLVCKKEFDSRLRNQIFCGKPCVSNDYHKPEGSARWKHLPSATTGALQEYRVVVDLLDKGYAVFRAVSPSCFCDLIAVKNRKTIHIEVATGYSGLDGKILHSHKHAGLREGVDCFAIALPSSIIYEPALI